MKSYLPVVFASVLALPALAQQESVPTTAVAKAAVEVLTPSIVLGRKLVSST